MLVENRWALKEWAVVCAALAAGRQTVILRKGGIAEGPNGFQVEHPEFWLLPTRFHQSADELAPDAAPCLTSAAALAPPSGHLRIELYAEVTGVARLESEHDLAAWTPRQILSADAVQSRFHYRSPGLFALTLRVHRRQSPWMIADLSAYAGCHSWVELAESLTTDLLAPISSPPPSAGSVIPAQGVPHR